MEHTESRVGKAGQDPDVEAQSSPPTPDEKEETFVDWDGPDDPENPFNWPLWRKTVQIGLMTFNTFIT